ncbi:MAG: hypothetical protein R2865_03105 [Deinococcales bacterium]
MILRKLKPIYQLGADYARKAIAIQEREPEAHMELARALGRLAQYRGVLQSLGLAGEVKKALERALELDPNHDGAMHALALYHDEVPFLVGGRAGESIPLFEKAIAIAPDSIIHRLEFAELLLKRNMKDEAKAQLEALIALTPETASQRQDFDKVKRLSSQFW